ncbi:helix-turn-helix domain-containing protein [Nocardioides kongjuensis]|uniref:Transcriptional regulator with XRE-family HTH domain n=1 Tax=Nocardioides kongjuensis TaxID=349522 RepID=A0A852RQ90_9ACTN|nr:XRE family transcriptional regulator [Nocardioides kongjuensis]NYD32728.1 transcriptional regulator with XRE-family HTH domain [Nocardioides kongjuensis]
MSRTDNAKTLAKAMGVRLRRRRKELGLSLSEVGRRSDVSPSYLTAVEAGTSTASLQVLARIAHALELTLGDFIAEQTVASVKAGRLDPKPGTHLVSSDTLQLKVAFANAEPDETGTCPLDVAGSSVVIVVRSGHLTVDVDDQTWQLEEGDSLHAQQPRQIRWRSGSSPSAFIWASAPPSIG